jgi:hexosaminidase
MTASYDEQTNSIFLEMSNEQPSPEIRYTTDGSEPDARSDLYEKPFPLTATATVKASIFSGGRMMGKVSEKSVNINLATGKKVTYNIPYSEKYRAFGDMTLVNGIRGSGAFNDGQWQGFEGSDMDVVIDLGRLTDIKHIQTRFIPNVGSWIFLPQYVLFSTSRNGIEFTPSPTIDTSIKPGQQSNEVNEYFSSFPEEYVRYVKVFAKGLITCPPWHPGAGGKAWMFCDEIIVE